MESRCKKIFRERGALFALVVFWGACWLAGCSDKPEVRKPLLPAQMNAPEYRIGVAQGTSAMSVVEARFPKSRIEYHMSLHDGYLAVQYGRIDAFAFDRHSLQYVAAHQPGLALLDEKIGDELIVVGAAHGREALIGRVNDFIRQYRTDGTYAEMYRRWIMGRNPKMPDLPKPGHPAMTLVIGTDGRNEPMNFYENGRLTGFDIEFAERLALFLNAKLVYHTIEFPAVVTAAATGKIDLLISSLNATPERRRMMLFSDPYIDSEISLLVRRDRLPSQAAGITRFSQLAGKKVGVQTGTTYEQVLKRAVPDARPAYFTTFTDQIEAVKSGKISGFLADEVVAQGMIRRTSGIVYLKEWLSSNEYAFAFAQDQSRLQRQVNAELRRMRNDGTLKRLAEKWFGENEDARELPDIPTEDKNGVIRFATNSDSAPFVYVKNGKLVGYDIEVAMIIARQLGKKLEILDMDFSAIIPALVSGKTDMAGDFIAVTPERAKSVLFSLPYYTGGTVVVVASAAAETEEKAAADFSQLAGRKVGIITGSTYDGVLKKANPGAVPEYFQTFADQAEALRAGKIAAFLVDEPIARDIMNHTEDLMILPDRLTSDGYAFAFSRSRPDLRRQFNEALEEMRAAGALQKIDAKWFGKNEAAKVLPEFETGGSNGVIRLATNSGLPPFAYRRDGRMVGYDMEIVMTIARKFGWTVEIADMEVAAIIPSLISGKSDMAACGITITEERSRSVLFSDPNYKGGIAVMVKAQGKSSKSAAKDGPGARLVESFQRTFLVEKRYEMVLQGLRVTLIITLLSAVFGTILGFGICMMRRAQTRWANLPARFFIRAVQGTPIIVLLMILYYIVFGSTNLDAMIVAVIGFSINFAAYVSEMMRTGMDAVDRGQHEAAYALGFNRVQVFQKITFPQAARHVLPVFKGEFISMLKMTSVVGYIAIQDLTKMSDIIRSRTYEAFFPLIATALIYFVLAYLMAGLLSLVEIRVDPKRRKRTVKGGARA
ncbi:MAG: ABC transporter permease subunit [Smithellaceae bacterium]|nr:ABC transporter permease subunit [Smithellaceae bacterium]